MEVDGGGIEVVGREGGECERDDDVDVVSDVYDYVS